MMKRWISLALLGVLSSAAVPARAGTDFPVTTSSGQPKNGSRFLGSNGILLPWLNGHGSSSSKDSGRRNMASSGAHGFGASANTGISNGASLAGRHGYGFSNTAPLERRAIQESTGVLPNFSRMAGSMFKK